MPGPEPYDYLLLTALAEEHDALVEALRAVNAQGPRRARFERAPTGSHWGLDHPLGTLRVLTVPILGMGEERAREWTRLLLESVAPKFVGLIGIAGAADATAEFGDILIAERIWYYESAKVRQDDTEFRGPEHRAEGLLIDRLRNPDLDKLHRLFPRAEPWRQPRVGVIASGEKVVASDTLKSELLRGRWNVIGFEMEGHGFANEVIRALGSTRWFMVRSVSDHADRAKSDTYRLTACQRAAQFTVGFILDSDLCVPHDPLRPAGSPPPAAPASPQRDLLDSMALAFADRAPDAFLSVVGQSPGEQLPLAIRAAQAIAHWRRDDAEACCALCREIIAASGDRPDAELVMVATRLCAWSLLRLGDAGQAKTLLEGRISQVKDVSERGRWADLLAQCCRFSGSPDDEAVSLSWYAQARNLKAEGGDYFGEVIALQQMARVCLERLDFDGCEAHYRKATEVSASRDFPQRLTCDITSLLGLAWLDLIRRDDLHLRLAKRRLSLAGALLRDVSGGALERDLQAASSAMSRFLDVLLGDRASITGWQNVSAMWASVVFGQARVHLGENLDTVTREVIAQATGRPSIAPQAIPALLRLFRKAAAPPPSRTVQSCDCGFWPLSEWVGLTAPGDGVRLIEGLVSLYSLVINRHVGGERPGPNATPGLDKQVGELSQYGHSHPKLALAREIAAVATVVRQAIPVRNRWAHALPGGAADDLSGELDRFALSALTEARMLRSATWIDHTVVQIGDTQIDLAPDVVWHADDERREIRFPDRSSYSTKPTRP